MVEYRYDAWGNCTILKDSVLGKQNPFRYRSYYFDEETGLYYLKTRYYDPETCRFLNMDSIDYADPETVNGLNLYAYCWNNPINNFDPTGQFVISIGTAIGLGLAALCALFAWVETTYHPVQNAINEVGEAIGDLINNYASESININVKNTILPNYKTNNNLNNVLGVITFINIIDNIYFSRERNRGRDTGFIGLTDEELQDLLNEAKNKHDSALIQRILKEMKMRGMRNTRKQRGGPHMRGIGIFLLLAKMYQRKYKK